MDEVAPKSCKPLGLQALFNRMPSIREKRASLGQVSGSLALHDAVAKGKDHLARFVLDAVDDKGMVNCLDQHGRTPLIRAVKTTEDVARLRIVRMLLQYGAKVNIKDSMGRTALSYACESQFNDIIKELVKNNADPNLDDNNGNSPIAYCAQIGNEEGVLILARSFRRLGLEVDQFNADGMTPIMIASKNGHIDCARSLAYEAKASIYKQDRVRHMNAIEWAREGGCKTPEMELLLPKRRIRSRSTKTQHLSLDKSQKTFDDGPDRDFNKALSCDCYLPDIGGSTPDNSPILSQRRLFQQNINKLSRKLHMKSSKSLSKLEQSRPLSASSPIDGGSQISLDLGNNSSKLSRSFDNVLANEDSSSTHSLSPHPPYYSPKRTGCSPRMIKSYLSRSHETLSEATFAREQQSSVKSSTNVELDIVTGIVKMNNGHHRSLERQRAVANDNSFTHLPPLMTTVNRKSVTQEIR